MGIQQFIHYIDNNTQLSFAHDVELITIGVKILIIAILSMENNYMWRQYVMYKDSLYQLPHSITWPSPNKSRLITHSSPEPNLCRNADSPVFPQRFGVGNEWALIRWQSGNWVIGIESLCMQCIVFTYNYSPYLKWKGNFYFWQYLKFWLSILCHVQSSIVCYCLYNVWIVVSWLFICDVEAWLIQILIFEVKHCIWALILLKVEIVVICQFLLKISVSHKNSI